MTKFVHCTVVKTRVFGRVVHEDNRPQQEQADPNPGPTYKSFKGTYRKEPDSTFIRPTILDLKA